MKRLVFAVLVAAASVCTAGPQRVTGDISHVIVYRGQALVTRTIPVKGSAGDLELIVHSLPMRIVPESLYAQSGDGSTVLSVRYRERAVREDTREEVKKLDDEIQQVSRELKHAEDQRLHYGILWERYDPFWKVTVEAGEADFDRALLQPDSIEQTTGYLEAKMNELHEKRVELADQIEDLKKQLEVLNRRRSELAAGQSRTEREAVVFLSRQSERAESIQLSYLVNDAGWSPQYNLRAAPQDQSVTIEYLAVVHQASGEDWTGTELALSTAEPSLVASPPVLEPLKIRLVGGRPDAPVGMPPVSQPMPQVQMQQSLEYLDRTRQFERLVQSRRDNIRKGKMAEEALNDIALSNQVLELQADRDLVREMQQKMAVLQRTEGVSVMYRLPGQLSLPSRSDQQLVTIDAITTGADYTLVATPVLTDYVYLQGRIRNDSDTILLPGPAAMYRNGEFVGRGQMNLVTIGQDFTTGFGIDSQVQVARKFEDKKIETLWGNRVDEQKYSITISNYHDEPVKLRLLERIPFAENPNIEVALQEPSHPLSEDKEYLRNDRDKGILRWDLELAANSTGEDATVVTYSYTLKYDNDMHIQPVSQATGQ